MIHHLKTLTDYFQAVIDERKPFEIRENDRNFKVGDIVVLEEFIKTEHIPQCSHFEEIEREIVKDEEIEICKYNECEECRKRFQKCHDFINHIYTGRTCTVIIKDIFDISFLLPNYVAFTFNIKHKRLKENKEDVQS